MFGIGSTELIICGIIAVLLFGSRLPTVARSLGRSLNEFKRGMRDVEDEVKDAIYSEPAGHLEDHVNRREPQADDRGAEPQADAPRETADTHGN
jgi:sec-independent protein translocase protein TatA